MSSANEPDESISLATGQWSAVSPLINNFHTLKAKGAKAKEKQNALDSIESLLQDQDVQVELNRNSSLSKRNNLVTWNVVFTQMESYFDTEISKAKVSEQRKQGLFSLMQSVIKKANTTCPYLEMSTLLRFVNNTFSNEDHISTLALGLLNILSDLLKVRHYTAVMNKDHWKKVLVNILLLYGRGTAVPKDVIIDILNKIIIFASDFPGLLPIFRNQVIEFFVVNLKNRENSISTKAKLLQGVVHLCRCNAVEFRHALCKFGEDVIPDLLNNHSLATEDEAVKAALIEFLILQIKLHTPFDVDFNSPAFCASDRKSWRTIVEDIYMYCYDSIERIVTKKNSGYLQVEKVSSQLYALFVQITKQVTNLEITDEMKDPAAGPSNKKQMNVRTFTSIVTQAAMVQPSEGQLIWIEYIKGALNCFPELIEDKSTFVALFQMGLKFLHSRFVDRDEIYDFFLMLLKQETYLTDKGVVQERSKSWSDVWITSIKLLAQQSKSSEGETKQHVSELVQQLIICVQPSDIGSLLNLFTGESLTVNKANLKLLGTFLTNCTVPQAKIETRAIIGDAAQETNFTPRIALIDWLLSSKSEKSHDFEKELATLLCSLIVRKSHILIQQTHVDDNFFQTQATESGGESGHEEFEEILVAMNFVKRPSSIPDSASIEQVAISDDVFVVQHEVATNLIHQLQQDAEDARMKVPQSTRSPEEFLKRLKFVQNRTSLLLNIFNMLVKHHVVNANDFGNWLKKKCEDLFVRLMNEFELGVTQFLETHSKNLERVHFLVQMMGLSLKPDHLCTEARQLLAAYYPDKLTDFLKKVFRSGLHKYVAGDNTLVMPYAQDVFSINMLKDFQQLASSSLEALKNLLQFGLTSNARTDFFGDILDDLNSEDFYILHTYQFDLCEAFVRSIVPVIQKEKTLHNRLFELLQKVCRVYFTNSECNAKLWHLFAVLTPAVAKDPDDTEAELVWRKLMRLVGGFSVKIMDYNIQTCNAAFKMLSVLAQNDPALNWSWFLCKDKSTETETYIQILTSLTSTLRNRSHLVRMLTVNTVHEIFLSSSSISSRYKSELIKEAIDKRKKLYTQLHEDLMNAFNVPEKGLPHPDDVDEKSNKTSLVLSSLAKTVIAYPFEQRRVLFSLILFVKLKSVDVALACRSLNSVNPNFIKVVASNISYLIFKWIKVGYKIEEFPFQFLGCIQCSEFCHKFKKEITLELFEHNQIDALNVFASRFGASLESLIKECYGAIMGRLSPHLAMLKNCKEPCSNVPKHVAQANEGHKRLITILSGKNVVEALMQDFLGDVVLNLISVTYSPSITEVWGCPEIVLPEPEPPYHDEDGILVGLEFLKESSPQKVNIIGHLLQTAPKSIYKILLTLLGRIHNAQDPLDKYWRLHQYSFFVKLLLSEPKITFEWLKEFLCKFLVHSYMRLLHTEEDERFLRCVLLLTLNCCAKLVDLCVKELRIHFRFIIRRLVRLRLKFPGLHEVIQEALGFFLHTNGDRFANEIVALDPFPEDANGDEDIFQEFKHVCTKRKEGMNQAWSLSTELETCFADIDEPSVLSREKLRVLQQLLASRKSELEALVQELQGKRFMDECRNNVLHKLLKQLIEISTRTNDQETVFEACRCLGEIGAVDLSVLVMPPFGRKSKISSMITAIPSIIESIVCYLTDDDFETVVSTGEVLQSLLEVAECDQIVNREIKLSNYPLFSLLTPFMSANATARSSGKVNTQLLEAKLKFNEFDENMDYNTWIIQLTCGLIAPLHPEGLAARLVPLCKQKVEFCEDIIPFIVFYLLYSGRSTPAVRTLIGSYVQQFLDHFKALEPDSSAPRPVQGPSSPVKGKNLNSIYHNKLALRCILGIVQFLREHTVPQEIKGATQLTPWDNNFWLELNYLDLAKAAQFCGAYLTSILYAEIYALWYNESDVSLSENDEFYSQDTTSFPQSRNQAEQIEALLLKAYSTIGEQDATYGCGYSRLYDFDSNVQYLQQMKKWERSLCLYDSQPSSHSHLGVCKSMKEIGLYETLWTYMQGIEDSAFRAGADANLMEIQYECGWRLSKWDLNCNKTTYITKTSDDKVCSSTLRNKFLFESIQNGLSRDSFSLKESIQSGFTNIVEALRHASLESSANVYRFLSDMQCLRTAEDYFSRPPSQTSIDTIVNKWQLQDRLGFSDFKYQEPILYLRNVLLSSFRQRFPSSNIDRIYDDSVYQLVSKAREAGRIELAEKSAMKFLEDVNKTRKHIEVARNHCARGEQNLACHLIKRVADKIPGRVEYPPVLLLQGEWLFQTKAERPVVIIEKIVLKAVQLYECRKDLYNPKERAEAHLSMAKLADAQYQSICNYVKSDMFNEKANQLQKAREEQTLADAVKSDEVKKSQNILRKQANLDQAEMNTTIQEKKRFVLFALRHYLRTLSYVDDHDLIIFRVIGLWLERADFAQDDLATEANKFIVDAKLPSIKYVSVLHQLSARMGVNHAAVNTTIHQILTTCAKEHPYQALPVLLTQALLHKDKEIRARKDESNNVADRVRAAKVLVTNLKRFKDLTSLINTMEEVWEALIELANAKDGSGDSTRNILPNMKLMKLKYLASVPVPIANISPICSPNKSSPSFVGIASFSQTYSLVGGINSPKRIACTGTNGRIYDMLLKGHDDLRQDALMQQVFGVMNQLLHLEPHTKIRRLQVRTYKVVPLSQRSGIIEWCQNTHTFGEYLVGSQKDTGAHVLYRPDDYKPSECRRKMADVRDGGDNQKKVEVFMDIVDHFKPVFRHFFLENFKDAGTYFERRLAYTRSVAASSMVGYILGLGDRHVANILVDKTTAEFIHIDLGVAFEQGRILPTPETIPFRLTRDVVDGMGVAGVEGVFRRSAEMTLEVLRSNSEIILTILEVLLYDPLYIWTLTADRVQKVQPGDQSKQTRRSSIIQSEAEVTVPKERNNSAARVLLRLKQKLLGIEEGGSSGSSLSVPGHVSLLIQMAVDPDRLSRVFPGWQPYL